MTPIDIKFYSRADNFSPFYQVLGFKIRKGAFFGTPCIRPKFFPANLKEENKYLRRGSSFVSTKLQLHRHNFSSIIVSRSLDLNEYLLLTEMNDHKWECHSSVIHSDRNAVDS